MKKKIIIIALFAIIILFLIGLRWNQVISSPTGGGPYLKSPDGKYIALAMLLTDKSFFGERKYYKFKIMEKSNRKTIKFLCIDTYNELGFAVKEDTEIISWSPDSKEATFTFADFSLNMDIN